MKLFISYAHKDKPLCAEVIKRLGGVHEVWYDERLLAGQRWWDEIKKRLNWCDVVIYLISPASLKSSSCQNELSIAHGLRKTIVPLIIKKNWNGKIEIPADLSVIQYVDLSKSLDNFHVVMGALVAIEREILQEDDFPKLTQSLVREKMIIIDSIFRIVYPRDEHILLEEILRDLKSTIDKARVGSWYRIPIFKEDGSGFCVVHTSTIDRYRVDAAVNQGVDIKTLTLKDLLDSDTGQELLVSSFAVVSDRATMAMAQAKMNALKNCQDVLVTSNGMPAEPVLGWITNKIIEQAIQV